jgi:hypothetical protein
MVWMALYFLKSKGREYIQLELKHGFVCYRCKTKIKEMDYLLIDKIEKPELCVSCKRNDALSTVMGKKLSFLSRIDFTHVRWSTYFTYLSILSVVFNIANLYLPGIIILGGLCLFIGQSLFYYRFMAITRKKETQSN